MWGIYRKLRLCIVWILCFQILSGFTSLAQGAAAGTERKVVRVGFFAWDGYHVQDERGVKRGYGYDFLKMMENYNNWKYEYIGYEKTWADMVEMLEAGELDLVTSAQKTPEREAVFDYSASPIGTSSTIVTVKNGDRRYTIGDASSYDGIRIGMLTGSSRNEKLAAYAAEHGINYEPVYYGTMAAMQADFQDRKNIDAMLTSNLRTLENETILEEFDPVDFYVIVKKGNTELKNEIDSAINQMDMNVPGWRLNLKNAYYSDAENNVLSFDRDQLDYVKELTLNHKVLRVVTNPDLAPYSYYEDGVAKGIVPEIFREIAKRIGLQYEIMPTETYEEYNEFVRNGGAEIDLTCFADYGLAEFHGLDLSNSYMSTTMALLTREGFQGKPSKIAVLKLANNNTTYFKQITEGMTYQFYDTNAACIQAVLSGEADGMYMYTYTAQKAVEEDARNRLKYSTLPEYSINMAIGVRNDQDYRLITILNEGIVNVKGSYVTGVLEEQLDAISKNDSLTAFIYDYPAIAVAGVSLVLVLVFMSWLTTVYVRNLQKEMKQRELLKDALESAKTASAAKGQFLSRMSHEIRTPLNAVIGYMDIAKESGDNPEKIMHCIENSDVAAKHLLSIINDVLDISSIESGKMKIASETFDLKKQISGISAMFYHQAQEKKVRFEADIRDVTEERVVGDSLRLNQILMNLLSNAVKFTPQGGLVRLVMTQMNMTEKQVFMKFEVSDTGIGMSKEYQEKLFTPFEQESASTAKKYGGSGLGLSITYNLIQMMGGTIDVDSEQGRGTTFAVSLYFGRSKDKRAEGAVQRDYSNVRVLIVDDEENSCEYMKGLLKRCKVRCDIALNGEKAIQQIRRRMGTDYKYDLCIMDWSMPGMNGIETARKIREECHADIPIIIATGYDVTEIEDDAKKAGVDRIIAKPLFQSTMFDLLVSTYGKYEPEKMKDTGKKSVENLAGLHVLLAEDNAMNMEIAVDILSRAGITVDQALNGQEACDKFAQSRPGAYDVILMDIQMPILDGYQATGVIRKSDHAEAKTIPIIAMTANAFAEDVTAALASGMNGHISKPIDYDKLFSELDKCRREKHEVEE